MNNKKTARKPYSGFTLAEMLVVLLIVVILAGLISAAAYRALYRGKVARVSIDIQQLSLSLEKYKQQFGEYPPDFSSIDGSGSTADIAAENLVMTHLSKAFPRYTAAYYGGASYSLNWANLRKEIQANSKDSSGNAQIDINTMNPSTALVFWLGGMPDAQGKLSGFSQNPADPFESPATTSSRIGPLFDFDPGHLKNSAYYAPPVTAGSGKPYIYLRAEQGQPQLKREYYSYDPTGSKPYTFKKGGSGAQPYWDQRNGGWVNPDSFQILFCGLDAKFGKENVYPTGTMPSSVFPFTTTTLPGVPADVITDLNKDIVQTTDNPTNIDHLDDQTNFAKGTIGDDLP